MEEEEEKGGEGVDLEILEVRELRMPLPNSGRWGDSQVVECLRLYWLRKGRGRQALSIKTSIVITSRSSIDL